MMMMSDGVSEMPSDATHKVALDSRPCSAAQVASTFTFRYISKYWSRRTWEQLPAEWILTSKVKHVKLRILCFRTYSCGKCTFKISGVPINRQSIDRSLLLKRIECYFCGYTKSTTYENVDRTCIFVKHSTNNRNCKLDLRHSQIRSRSEYIIRDQVVCDMEGMIFLFYFSILILKVLHFCVRVEVVAAWVFSRRSSKYILTCLWQINNGIAETLLREAVSRNIVFQRCPSERKTNCS